MLGSADETVEAKMPTPEIRRELFMEENQPLVYKERVTYDIREEPWSFPRIPIYRIPTDIIFTSIM